MRITGSPIQDPSPAYLAESKVDLAKAFYAIPIPLEILSTLFRLWVRTRKPAGGRLLFDDYLMIWATVVGVVVCVIGLIFGPPHGLGRHIEAVSMDDRVKLLIGDYIFSHFYNMAIGFTKLSVLALYWRVFATKPFRHFVLATAVFVSVWIVVMEVVLGLGCRPIHDWWGAYMNPGNRVQCIDKVGFTFFTNITNLVSDLWIFTMPIPMILRLQASLEKRLGLVFLFSVGLGVCVLSAIRLSMIIGMRNYDFTWHIASIGILSAWEPCGGILCANLPIVYRSMANVTRGAKHSLEAFADGGGGSRGSARYTKAKSKRRGDWQQMEASSSTTLAAPVHHVSTSMDGKRDRFSGETEMMPYPPIGLAV